MEKEGGGYCGKASCTVLVDPLCLNGLQHENTGNATKDKPYIYLITGALAGLPYNSWWHWLPLAVGILLFLHPPPERKE
jgi:hypothetical protein